MKRIILLLVTLMPFSLMAQITDTKDIDLACMAQVSRICPEIGCKTFYREEIIERDLAQDFNLSVRRDKFEQESELNVPNFYIYSWDIGTELEFVAENSNKLYKLLDGDDDYVGDAFKGKTVSHEFNLLTKEYIYEVKKKNSSKDLLMRTNYFCEENKSLFD